MNNTDERTDVFIHSTSNVSEEAQIGSGTKIWINSQIRENAIIGENCIISKDTYVDSNVNIGSGVKIQNGVSVYQGVYIEDDVFVGPNAVFTNDYYPRANNSDWKILDTIVRKGASLGANCTIVCGNTIGEYAMVGAGSVVIHDVPPHALVVGNPARQIGYVCHCGRRISDDKYCNHCDKKIEV